MITLWLSLLLASAQEVPTAALSASPAEAEAVRGEAQRPDRSRPPAVSAPELMALPDWEEHLIGNGVVVRHVLVPGVRKVDVRIRRGRGCADLGAPTAWSCKRAGWMMDQGTARLSPAELEIQLDLLGANLWSEDVGQWQHSLGIDVPQEDLDGALSLLGEVLRTPRFEKRDLKRDATETKRYITQYAPLDADAIAQHTLDNAWFAPGTPWDPRTDPAAIVPNAAEMLAYNERLNREAPLEILVVGDIPWSDLQPKLVALVDGLGVVGARTPPVAAPPISGARVLAIDLPHAAQTVLRLGMNAPPFGHADAAAFRVVNHAYGGAFLSRLNNNLREERGITYGAGSRYQRGIVYGRIVASTSVAAENTGVAIEQFGLELQKLADAGATEEELLGATLLPTWNETLMTAGSAAAFYADRVARLESQADARAWYGSTEAITPAQTAEVAARWLGADAPRVWVIVGPRAQIEPQLTALGLAPEWLAPKDAVLGVGW